MRTITATLAQGLRMGLTVSLCVLAAGAAAQSPQAHVLGGAGVTDPVKTELAAVAATRPSKRANFGHESVSADARKVADWVVDSGDSHGMPFLIVEKTDARVYVFDANGRLRGAARALLGLARGDDSVPGIGTRKLSTILPEERTTPAGRFVAALDKNLQGSEILWVDYDAAISLHPVITTHPEERRAQRLATASSSDKRISYGCINVPPAFFHRVVHPTFARTNGVVYVLPEVRPLRESFSFYDVDERALSMGSVGLPGGV